MEGQDVEVLVIDAGEAILAGISHFTEVDGASFFFSDDPAIGPAPDVLLRVVKDWLGLQAPAKAAFYSADEEMISDEVPITPQEPIQDDPQETPKRKPAGKPAKPRVTTASLAEQIGSMSSLLPSIASRLDQLQQEQVVMKSQLALSGEHCASESKSAAGVYQSLEFCKDDGISSSSQSSATYSRAGGHSSSAGRPLYGPDHESAGAAGGVPCNWSRVRL